MSTKIETETPAPLMEPTYDHPVLPGKLKIGDHIEFGDDWAVVQEIRNYGHGFIFVRAEECWLKFDSDCPVLVQSSALLGDEVLNDPDWDPERVTPQVRVFQDDSMIEATISMLNKNKSSCMPPKGIDGEMMKCEVFDLEPGHYVKNNDAWTLVTSIGRESHVTFVGLRGYPERLVVPNQGPTLEVCVIR